MPSPQFMFINSVSAMNIHINPECSISEVQKEFNALYPFLKIEFFNNKSFAREDFLSTQIIPSNRKIGEMHLTVNNGDIEINDNMKVKDLEKIFKDKFNLAVQVFRKSGNLWLETTMTDNWTLEQQNEHGLEISTGNIRKEKPDDFDLTRDSS